ncbi:hypothetical protein NTGBS_470050 [Candidatus Nitrotoga sp. BS]|uniref:hypothetical protein n=1 Tax=Candidatus Nitrotoga sp. BS TaxID=2890408 RepID=UPI001EF1FB4E|nr:hypothetical protein [Candidatus Nitrotoga sp. BS]CAH1202365.1 hypothetical protein NTGBS_470050 [Candidatus Nitrotoga sp. BS]
MANYAKRITANYAKRITLLNGECDFIKGLERGALFNRLARESSPECMGLQALHRADAGILW